MHAQGVNNLVTDDNCPESSFNLVMIDASSSSNLQVMHLVHQHQLFRVRFFCIIFNSVTVSIIKSVKLINQFLNRKKSRLFYLKTSLYTKNINLVKSLLYFLKNFQLINFLNNQSMQNASYKRNDQLKIDSQKSTYDSACKSKNVGSLVYPLVSIPLSQEIKILLSVCMKYDVVALKGQIYFSGTQQVKIQRPYIISFIQMVQLISKTNKSISNYHYSIENQQIIYTSKIRILKSSDDYDKTVKKIASGLLKELKSTFKMLLDILQISGICKTKNLKIISRKNIYLNNIRKILNSPQLKKEEKVIEHDAQPKDQKSKQIKVHDILKFQDRGTAANQDQVKKGGYFLIQKRNVKITTQYNQQLKDLQYQIFAAKIFNPKQKYKKSMNLSQMKQIQIQKRDNQLKIVSTVRNTQYLINYYRITPETIIQNSQSKELQKMDEEHSGVNLNKMEQQMMEVEKQLDQASPQASNKLPYLNQKVTQGKSTHDESNKLKIENRNVCIYMQHFQHSLSDYIYFNEFISIEESIALCIQIVKAVITLHQSGVVHRDLKPSNILMDTSDPNRISIRIIDFGQSCNVKDDIQKQKNKGSTIPYSPPQSQQNTKRGRTSLDIDKWSVGIIIYQLLNRKLPVTYSKAFLGDIQATWPNQFLMPIDISEKQGIKVVKNVLNFMTIRMVQVNPDDRAGLKVALFVLEQTKNYIKDIKSAAS